jgi:hypothetical protein
MVHAAWFAATPKSHVETTRTAPLVGALLDRASTAPATGDSAAAAAPSAAVLRKRRRLVMTVLGRLAVRADDATTALFTGVGKDEA